MGDAVADRRTSRPSTASELIEPLAPGGPTGPELRVSDLILFDTAGSDPVTIEAIVFTDEGIGVVRTPGGQPRVLPWSAVATHVVERWSGGVVPAWWVAPQPRRNGTPPTADSNARPPVPDRRLPAADPGAVIAIQTPFGTYRFLRPGADPVDLSNRITDFAVRHQGLSGVPSVTVVARPVRGGDRRQGTRARPTVPRWTKVQPYLVVALVVFLATVVTLILLQSAGVIHLPYLGGTGSGGVRPIRTR